MNCQSQQYHHHHPMYTTTTADSSNHHNNNQNKVGSPPMGYKSHKRKFFETFMRENEDEEEYLPIQQNKRFLSEEMALQLHKMNISDHQSNQLLQQQQQQQQFDHNFTTNNMNSNPAVPTTNSITDDHNSVERDPLIHDPKQQLSSFHENKKIIIPPIIADQLRLNASVIQPAYYVRAVVPYKDHISESLSRKSTVTSPTNMLPSINAIPTTPSQIPTIVITDHHHHLNTNNSNSNNNDNSSNMMTDD